MYFPVQLAFYGAGGDATDYFQSIISSELDQ